jgi:hypothetical protein
MQNTAKSLPNLSEEEAHKIHDIFREIRLGRLEQTFRTRDGPKGRVLEDFALGAALPNNEFQSSDVCVFFHLPYFSLERLHSSSASPQGHLHPIRGLVQTKHPSTRPERELQQAVCQLPGIPTGHCFHVTGLWCLIVHNSRSSGTVTG